jgi:acyl dehydratase
MSVVSVEEYANLAGTEIGPGSWFLIDQDRINTFADATEDHQFIHIDPTAAARTPFGTTIAHGFLTLSMISHLTAEIHVAPEGTVMAINYGSDKVRFLQPVKVGQRIRLKGRMLEVIEKKPGQWLTKTAMTIEIEGEETPALIAEILSLFITQ